MIDTESEADTMSIEPSADETALFDAITELAAAVWEKSKGVQGPISDPRMVSTVLFRRLKEHHRAFAALWREACYFEGEIIARSSIETAICMAANSKMGNEFPKLMRQDAAATLQGQIKLHREAEETKMIRDSEAALRFLQAGFDEGKRAIKLDWKSLVEAGGVPVFYNFHKMLSGASSHVTGLSLIRGVETDETMELQKRLQGLNKRNWFNMTASATLHGSLIQAGVVEDAASTTTACALVERMNAVSELWKNEDAAT